MPSFLPGFVMTEIPPPNEYHVLPPGDYPLTLDQLEHSVLVEGPTVGFPNWNRTKRLGLVANLRILVGQLRQVGITEIYIDGSFVEGKDEPDDIDGYYVIEAQQLPILVPRLMQINPLLPRVADRRTWVHIPKKGERRPELYQQYHVELFWEIAPPAPPFFATWFRQTRTGRPKGIVRIV